MALTTLGGDATGVVVAFAVTVSTTAMMEWCDEWGGRWL